MNPSQTTSMQPRTPKQATSVGQVFALVAGFLALAAIGATLGWTLTDTSGGTPIASASLSPSVPVTAKPTVTPSPSVTTTATHSGEVVPDFAKQGTSFITARTQLMALKIQAIPVFEGGSGGDAVVRTSPAAGRPMARGDTIKLYVNELAPPLPVPDETGKVCKTAGKDVAAVGFRTAYATGSSGVVTSQDPPSTSGTAHWNDVVELTCSSPPPPSPSASPSTSAAAVDPPSAPSS